VKCPCERGGEPSGSSATELVRFGVLTTANHQCSKLMKQATYLFVMVESCQCLTVLIIDSGTGNALH
jgi:hypothetical protein